MPQPDFVVPDFVINAHHTQLFSTLFLLGIGGLFVLDNHIRAFFADHNCWGVCIA